jgi:hydroxysqualene dehydroxylase
MVHAVRSADVVVVGAGFAGLAAAVRLADAGVRVVVVEQGPRLGGRASAFTDKGSGERVDNGQHVLFGCYRHTYSFLRQLGTEHLAPLQPRLTLAMLARDGQRHDLVCPDLRPPFHLLAGLLRWPALSVGDRVRALRIGPVIARARRAGAAAVAAAVPPGLTVEDWLTGIGQSVRARAWIWHPLTLAALNQSPHTAAAAPFVRVLAELFGPRAEDAAVGLARVPLDELYAEPARRFIEARGGAVLVGEAARIEWAAPDTITGVRTQHGVIATRQVVSAVPWFAFHSLWEAALPPVLQDIATHAAAMQSVPIVTVNLWLDGPAIDTPFVGLVDGPMHWVFDKAQIWGGVATHLALVTSGAAQLAATDNVAATQQAMDHLRAALPAMRARTLLRSVVVREQRATFSLAPGAPPRPSTRTSMAGFYLAGDWTETGLPATIEGAVQSGHRAADAVLASRSEPDCRRQ